MAFVQILFFYVFCSSSVLVYGTGLKQSFVISDNMKSVLFQGIKTLFLVTVSCALLWPLVRFCMVPYRIASLYPFVSIFIVVACAKLVDSLFSLRTESSQAEIIFALGVVILSINESFTFVETLVTAVSCCLSFCIISIFLYVIKYRIYYADSGKSFGKGPLLFISMGLLALAFYAWNVSWWNGAAG